MERDDCWKEDDEALGRIGAGIRSSRSRRTAPLSRKTNEYDENRDEQNRKQLKGSRKQSERLLTNV